MILKDRECTLIGTIENNERIYDFGYDGVEVIYDKRLNNGNHENGNERNQYRDFQELVEKIVFNKISNELVKEYGNLDDTDKIENMKNYINLLNKRIGQIKISENLTFDLSTVEKARETEEKFLSMCDDIFKKIDSDIKSEIKLLNSDTTVIDINNIKNEDYRVFESTNVKVSEVDNEVDIETLRSKLTLEEEKLLSIYMSTGIDERTSLFMVYQERDSVKEYLNEGYLLPKAIEESFKHTKVKVLNPPKPNNTGFVDMFALLIVGEVFIYGLIIAILMFIK